MRDLLTKFVSLVLKLMPSTPQSAVYLSPGSSDELNSFVPRLFDSEPDRRCWIILARDALPPVATTLPSDT